MNVDWGHVFGIHTPLLEILVRGSVVYLGLFLLLRLVLKRQAGAVGITDLLVIVLIADAAQNAMADDYTSITDGIILVTVIIFWSHALDWLGYKFPAFNTLVHPPPLPLVRDGMMIRYNMRRELISEEELQTQLREQGVMDVREVKAAHMEGDGRISVVPYSKDTHGQSRRPAT